MDNCIFCKIIAGEIPSFQVFEDENNLAFLDIRPVNPGHTLIIPKKHVANLEEISEEDLCSLIKAAKIIGRKIITGLGFSGYNLTENNNSVAGQIIPHLHFHLIPRKDRDELHLWPQREYKDDEAPKIAEKIKNA